MAAKMVGGKSRKSGYARRTPIGLAAALALGLSVAGASAGEPSIRSGDGIQLFADAPVQPLKTGAAPESRYRLPFGTLRVNPTALVAGAPDQDLTITVDPSAHGEPDTLRVHLYSRRQPDYGRGVAREEVLSETLDLNGAAAGEITLSHLNLPPRRYRLDLLTASGNLIERGAVEVYAQHRLPPGVSPAGYGGAKHGDSSGGRASGRALANPSVNNNVSFQFGQQAETYAAVEPDNSARVIGAVNPDFGNPQAWISNDSMRPGTDVINTLPSASQLAETDGGGGVSDLSLCCDPALAADDRGNLWYSVLTTGSSSHIVINRAAGPSGTSFQSQNVAIPRDTTGLQDKNMITVDSWASSPKQYTLYAVWVENPGQTIVISQCDGSTVTDCDDPDFWSTPVEVSPTGGTLSYPSVATAPNGDVYVVWWDQTNDDITLDRCPATELCDDTASWNEDADIDNDLDPGSATSLPFFCPIIGAPGGRVGPQTYVDVGPDGRVYVAYSELRNNGTTRCSASGTDRTFESRIAAGAANTFPTLNSGVRVSDDSAAALNDHFFPSLAADPAVPMQVETSLYSTKLDASGQTTQQFYVVSTNGGASYSPMQQITTQASDFSSPNSDGFDYGDYEGADAAGGLFYPAWTDNRASHGGDAELYMLTPEAIAPPPPPPAGDTDPPETTITSGPPNKVKTRKKQAKATFGFQSSEAGSSFQCSIDGAPFAPCTSPNAFKVKAKKKTREHDFDVRATDAAGNTDPTPAEDDWKVKRKKKK
jgi:hypothetical protein